MDIYLLSHLTGAFVTAIVCVISLISAFYLKNSPIQHYIVLLSGLSVFQFLSGGLLALAQDAQIVSVCSKFGLYALLIIGTQIILINKTTTPIKLRRIIFPQLLNTIIAGFTILLLAIN